MLSQNWQTFNFIQIEHAQLASPFPNFATIAADAVSNRKPGLPLRPLLRLQGNPACVSGAASVVEGYDPCVPCFQRFVSTPIPDRSEVELTDGGRCENWEYENG